MPLTWHITLKHLRRLWPWLALITATIATRYGLLWHFEHRLDIDRPLFDRTAGTDSTLYIIQYLLLGLFVVSVAHEDSPLDRRAYWITRPISGLRLLTAKLIAIVLGGILLPLTGVLLWWWLHDFRACDIAASLPQQLLPSVVVTSIAFAFSLFNRTWLGFLLTFFSFFLLLGLGISSTKTSQQPDAALTATRLSLIFFCAIACLAVCTFQLYQRRRVRPAYTVLAAAIGVCLVVQFFWSWPVPARYRFSGNPPPPPAPNTAGIVVTPQPLRSFVRVTSIGDTSWYAQLPLTFSNLSSDIVPVTRRAKPANDSDQESLTVTPTRASKEFSPRLPASPATTEPYNVVLDLKRSDSFQPAPDTGDSPFNAPIHVSFLLRRVTPIAALANKPAENARTGPYHLRILQPSPPHSASRDWISSRAATCLLVHPSHLTAPGTGIAEYCGAPDDTDEYGGHFAERATLFATLNGTEIIPNGTRGGTLTFTADGIFFVRRTFSLDVPPADIASVKFHYVTYPALGTLDRIINIPAVTSP